MCKKPFSAFHALNAFILYTNVKQWKRENSSGSQLKLIFKCKRSKSHTASFHWDLLNVAVEWGTVTAAYCCTAQTHSSMLLQRALRHSSKQRINLALWRPPLLPLIASLNEDNVWRRSQKCYILRKAKVRLRVCMCVWTVDKVRYAQRQLTKSLLWM